MCMGATSRTPFFLLKRCKRCEHMLGSEQVLVAEQPDFENYGFLALNKPLFRSPHIIKESII